jgi:TonB family protein
MWAENLLDVLHLQAGQMVKPGGLPEDALEATLARVAWVEGQAQVELGAGERALRCSAEGEPLEGGELLGPAILRLEEEDVLRVEAGLYTWTVQRARPAQRVRIGLLGMIDLPFALGTAAVFGLTALIGGLMAHAGPPPESSYLDPADLHERLALVQLPPAPAVISTAMKGEAAPRARGAEGASTPKVSRRAGAGRASQERVEDMGLLGALADDGEVAGILGGSMDVSAMARGIGGMIGSRSTSMGVGLGQRGAGIGGGGKAESMGGLRTRGRGDGEGGYGREGGQLSGGKQEGAVASLSTPLLSCGGEGGCVDRSLIAQVVQRNLPQIRYCYQKALQREPGLAGKMTVRFAIDDDGAVTMSSVQRSSMGNAEVEQCVASRVEKMRFPAFNKGTIVVNYPFAFSSGS